jgi:2-oxoglutarate/2-oxoacid ferredoxin oxidoreductase subunit beta
VALKLSDVKTDVHNDWCPGCGDFGIEASLQLALTEIPIELSRVALFSGIGCSGKIVHWTNTFGIHTLHGRVLPFAQGAKLANPNLEVIALGGDGDGFGIGAGHFVNAARRNIDLTYIVHDNQVYGLTKGQASPTMPLGEKTKSLPEPNINTNVNPIMLAFAAGFTFIARSYSFDSRHLKEMIKRAIAHKGFALLDVLQPCPTYNDIETKEWFGGEDRPRDEKTKRLIPRYYDVESSEGYDPVVPAGASDGVLEEKMIHVLKISRQWDDHIPIGVFYQNENVPTYEKRMLARIPNYLENPPAKQTIGATGGKSPLNFPSVSDQFLV